MDKIITFVTGNDTKVKIANEALKEFGYSVIAERANIIEPREEEPEMVVIEKAVQAFEKLKKPLIVEDSGIFIKSLNGFPKTFVHFAIDTIGVSGIIKLMENVSDRSVQFRQSLAYIEPGMNSPKIFSYIDGGFTVADKVWEDKSAVSADFDKILIPPGQFKPLITFPQEWRAKRDTEDNREKIHYHQLAHWLDSR